MSVIFSSKNTQFFAFLGVKTTSRAAFLRLRRDKSRIFLAKWRIKVSVDEPRFGFDGFIKDNQIAFIVRKMIIKLSQNPQVTLPPFKTYV